MTTGTTDRQRSRVYNAEQELRLTLSHGGTITFFGSTLSVPVERRFGDLASIRRYLDQVLAFAPVARLSRAHLPVGLRERRGAAKAHYEHDTDTIAIPTTREGAWALREVVVLHELAHHLCGASGHGREFTSYFLYLLDVVIGAEAAHMLRVAFYERGVEIGATP